MNSVARVLLLLALPAGGSFHAAAQAPVDSPSSTADRQERFGTGTTAVMVDVVVRDSGGEPVTDLRQEDFELLEDGIRQAIGTMTLVAPALTELSPRSPTAATNAAGSSPDGDGAGGSTPSTATAPTFLALVFDRLSPEARALAYKGALAALETSGDRDYAGVFVSDLSLKTLQTYTNDRMRLREALREAATRATSMFDRQATRDIQTDVQGDAHPSVPVTAGAEFRGRPVPTGNAGSSRTQDELTLAALGGQATWERLARDQQGYATTNALLALCTSLGALPGRKTVVLFAEGLSIPDAVLPHFRDVVTTANRANVSIYAVDAAGLRVHSKDAETAREVGAIAAAGLSLNPDGSSASSLGLLERNEDVLRKDPRTSLTLLAEQTGGFLVDSTNDLARAFHAIDADRRFHYLLTYTPKKTDFAGEWRRIAVKVPGRPVQVRSRSGYLAVRAPGTVPLLAYEGPAVAALERRPAPAEIPLRSAAFAFPRADGRTQLALLVAARSGDIRFDRVGEQYRSDFTIIARIADRQGRVVRKASRPYRLAGPAVQMDAARTGEVLFFRQPELEAGTYTFEAAVHDALAGRAGVARLHLTIPPASGELHVGSLVLISRAEALAPAERDPDNPLHLGEVVIYPNLGEPIRKTPDARLAFVLPFIAGGHVKPVVSLDVLQSGRSLVRAPLATGTPDDQGRVHQIGQLPVSSLSAGEYVLRLTVRNGTTEEHREAQFTVANPED